MEKTFGINDLRLVSQQYAVSELQKQECVADTQRKCSLRAEQKKDVPFARHRQLFRIFNEKI
jgi:hypothetical protein